MIIWLYGLDSFRSRVKLKEFKDKYFSDVDPTGNSLVILDGEDLDMPKLNEAISAPSLFARKRMIVVERLFMGKNKELRKKMAEFFNTYKDDKDGNIIVFWDEISAEGNKLDPMFKFLDKQKVKQEFKPLSATQAQDWVRTEVQARGSQMRIEAARQLVAMSGVDLWALNNEINKLINYKQSQKLVAGDEAVMIEAADVESLVRGLIDENIFALTDAISQRNKARALELLENEVSAGVADTYLMHMIIRQFRILLQVRSALDLGQNNRKIQTELKLHPFVVSKAVTQVRNFQLASLKEIFKSLVRIDQRLKTGRGTLKIDLDLLITAM